MELGCGFAERVVLMLALMPHVRPPSLDLFHFKIQHSVGPIVRSVAGGAKRIAASYRPAKPLPSSWRAAILANVLPSPVFSKKSMPSHAAGVIKLDLQSNGEPAFRRGTTINHEFLKTGRWEVHKPDFQRELPSQTNANEIGLVRPCT